MSEPPGLSLSLDDLIKKQNPFPRREDRFNKQGGRGAFAARGGVQKLRSPQGGGRGIGRGGFGAGRQQDGGFSSRGGYQGNRGGFGRGQDGGGRGQGLQRNTFGQAQQQSGTQNFRQQGNFRGGYRRPFQQQQQQQQRPFQQQQQRPFQQQQQRPFQQQQRVFEQPAPPPRPQQALAANNQMQVDDSMNEDSAVNVWMDVSTQDVVATMNGVNIVTVGPDGAVLLDTGSWFTLETLTAMNEVLSVIGMKVVVSGTDVSNGANWSVTDNKTMQKFQGNMVLVPAKGPSAAVRGEMVHMAYNDPQAFELAQQQGANRLGMMPGGGAVGGGRYPGGGARQFHSVGGMGGVGDDAGMYGGGGGGMGMGMGGMASSSMQGMSGGMGSNVWSRGMGMGMSSSMGGGGSGMGGGGGGGGAATGVIGTLKQQAAVGQFGGMGGGVGGGDADAIRRLRAQGRLGY